MKAVELRQAILQAAVQGKLVPQDLHDEPASELLARIRAEKMALIKEGIIKKEKSLPSIAEDEVPYDLPDGWVWCKLGDITQKIHYGYTASASVKGRAKMLRITDIQANKVNWNTVPFCDIEIRQLDDYLLHNDDILIARTGGTIGKTYLVSCITVNAVFASYLIRAVPFPIYNIGYIKYFLESPLYWEQLRDKSMGTGQPNVNGQSLSNLVLPLPPLAEQNRIVAKVDELMALCDELEIAEGELDALEKHFAEYLPKSILQHAVQGKLVPQDLHDEPASELLARIRAEKAALIKASKLKKEKPLPLIAEDEIPYDLPDGWVWCRLGSVCDYGTASNAEPDDIPDNSWILELEDIEKETGHLIDIVLKKNRMSKSTKHVFSERNVLYSKLRPYLNKVLVAGQDGYCTSEILPLDFGEIVPSYAVWFLRSPQFVEYANRCSYGVKMPRLGTEDGRMALFPLPPLAEQQRIVAKVDELMALCDELKVAKTMPVAKQAAKIIEFPKPVEPDTKLAFAARGDADNISKEAMDDIAELLGEFDDD